MREIPIAEWDSPAVVVSEWNRFYAKVTVDGVDVSNRAFEAHPVQGWVRAYEVDARGEIISSQRHVILVGKVEIEDIRQVKDGGLVDVSLKQLAEA